MLSTTLFEGSAVTTSEGLDAVPRRIGRSSLLWLDVQDGGDVIGGVAELLEIEPHTIERLTGRSDAGASLDDRPNYTHLSAVAPAAAAEGAELVRVDCLVGERWVVTVHDGPIAVLEEFRERATGTGATGSLDGPAFVATLLEWVMGEYAKAFDTIEAELEELDVRTLGGDPPEGPEDEMRKLVSLRRDIGSLQRALTSHREPILSLTHPELDRMSTRDSARRFRLLAERLDVTVQAGRDARASIGASFDVLMARTEHRTNEILKVLTLASVLFLPGSLVAGLLGMNFEIALFGHAFVFWLVVLFVLAVIFGTTLAARRRRWV